ncbi:acyltransferase [Abyssibacter profundi]|uniref:Acyltransferase n=1 Tax=Abyssibacter profundi TaxID=2182787 RepID=A0A383XPM5_9GAMM|nr:acyltransferase [Abyssibacter profundi]PWN54579.1 hypothetical protein DEH80_16595 [Abyssibacter profundi]
MHRDDELSPLKRHHTYLSPFVEFVRLVRRIMFAIQARFRISIGSDVVIGKGCEVYVPTNGVIGSHVSIGSNFTSQVDFLIEDYVLISSHVSLIGNDHDLYSSELAYRTGRNEPAYIRIGRGAFVGFGATILGNITVGRSAIIGARALVTRDVPDGAIVVGSPAKVLAYRKAFKACGENGKSIAR